MLFVYNGLSGEYKMPKKDGIMKTYSFGKRTIEQIDYLSNVLFLKPTSVLEFIINKAYNEAKQGKGNDTIYNK